MKKRLLFICSLAVCMLPVHLLAQMNMDNIQPDSARADEITLTSNKNYQGLSFIIQDRENNQSDPANEWFPNPNRTRLFFSPNAIPMKKGTGYYQNVYVFFSNAAYAVSDRISVSGGFSMLPGTAIQNQLYYITGKAAANVSGNHYIGTGIGVGAVPGTGETLFMGYGVYTYEMFRGNFTAGINGISIMEDVGSSSFLLGGDYRVSERIALVTENYIFPEDGETILSYGLRFMGERMSFDLAFFRPGLAEDIGFGVPYVDFVFNF